MNKSNYEDNYGDKGACLPTTECGQQIVCGIARRQSYEGSVKLGHVCGRPDKITIEIEGSKMEEPLRGDP